MRAKGSFPENQGRRLSGLEVLRTGQSQGSLRGPDERPERPQGCVLCSGADLARPGRAWSQSFKEIELSVPGNLAFLCEEAGVIIPMAAVGLVCKALEIPRVPLEQHSLTSLLRTVSLYGSCC